MTTKQKIVWRLSSLPTVAELQQLVKDKIMSQDEARDILFRTETEEDREKKDLQSEIKFLRDMVERLSSNRTQIVEIIKEIRTPYQRYDWYQPYWTWCTTPSVMGCSITNTAGGYGGDTNNFTLAASGSIQDNAGNIVIGNTGGAVNPSVSFSDIKTF